MREASSAREHPGGGPAAAAHAPKRAVLVTGASSGIGAATVKDLARRGYRVFAGVRSEQRGAELIEAAGGDVHPLRLDVTDRDLARAAADEVERVVGRPWLDGLVNNAGIAVAGPLEFLTPEMVRRQFDVNLFGQLWVTQALLPALRAARGRVVNVGSIGGRLGFPFIAPYQASKAALDSLTRSLRRELRPWGIHVALIEPGSVATPIWEKGARDAAALAEQLPPQATELYGPVMARSEEITAGMADRAQPVEPVTEAIHHALTARKPRPRYLLGRDARQMAAVTALLPERVVDRLVAREMAW